VLCAGQLIWVYVLRAFSLGFFSEEDGFFFGMFFEPSVYVGARVDDFHVFFFRCSDREFYECACEALAFDLGVYDGVHEVVGIFGATAINDFRFVVIDGGGEFVAGDVVLDLHLGSLPGNGGRGKWWGVGAGFTSCA
jgi:hypothetical protein